MSPNRAWTIGAYLKFQFGRVCAGTTKVQLGELIISPALYHPSFYDRRPDYTRTVRRAEQPVIIIDTMRFREAANIIEDRLEAIAVICRKTVVGRFVVYYDFPRRVLPEHPYFCPAGPLAGSRRFCL